MDIREQFEYNPSIDLTAAQIGINKWQWETINSEDEVRAKEFMKRNRFDVLPIINPDGRIERFYSTRIWNNYHDLQLANISESDTIYYRLSFSDLIKKFHYEKKHFYFLTNVDEVLGFVSFIHLNCLVVYNYLYQVFADLEQAIANLLRDHIDQKDILEIFKNSTNKYYNKFFEDYVKAVNRGRDNSIFDYMYLPHIGKTLGKFYHILPVKYHVLNDYSQNFAADGTYNILRNKIMHPVRPILTDSDTISNIDILLTDFQKIKEILR